MTNINNIQNITQIINGQSTKVSQARGQAQGFESLLSSAQEEIEAAKEGTQTSELGEISAPAFDIQTVSSIVTNKTDKLLTGLESYSSQLNDTSFTLKDIEPVLKGLDEDATSLLEEALSLGEDDQELIDIATSTAITAKTEYLKFQRGDYL
ncbi:hypothetical protein DO021_18980 [Desulfobacter hydrogenophilus]|uniref:Uncharacterized protein n=1 Tax=Desulfobacter hydrogenophilus TaxID=2291 RepID=A0A328F7V8_9BACT|nr:hypothetical protein [Desulfobacter hydrogenophilus]NDY73851.1 hypothetical protein [Desulfobacter hydrogenophilus]QBH13138.1 hypothetical protein EYB58_09540 [Desulfobacter hydrogenophilus]RAM00469.1 hypothetical protein DO021_18980 [Desulfobacter hydrogenophilus]